MPALWNIPFFDDDVDGGGGSNDDDDGDDDSDGLWAPGLQSLLLHFISWTRSH